MVIVLNRNMWRVAAAAAAAAARWRDYGQSRVDDLKSGQAKRDISSYRLLLMASYSSCIKLAADMSSISILKIG